MRLHIFVPDDTIVALDAQRGLASRSAWITHLIRNSNSATVITQDLTVDTKTVAVVPDEHTHKWNKKNSLLDVCIGCSEERPHILGTR